MNPDARVSPGSFFDAHVQLRQAAASARSGAHGDEPSSIAVPVEDRV